MLTIEDRLDRLEAQSIAIGAILRAAIMSSAPDDAARQRARDNICATLEGLYEGKVTPKGHDILQRALAEVELLFQAGAGGPGPRADAG